MTESEPVRKNYSEGSFKRVVVEAGSQAKMKKEKVTVPLVGHFEEDDRVLVSGLGCQSPKDKYQAVVKKVLEDKPEFEDLEMGIEELPKDRPLNFKVWVRPSNS